MINLKINAFFLILFLSSYSYGISHCSSFDEKNVKNALPLSNKNEYLVFLKHLSLSTAQSIPPHDPQYIHFLRSKFDHFKVDTNQQLNKDFGVDVATHFYHSYIDLKDMPSDCSKLTGMKGRECDYYLCREKKSPCKSDGYFLNYGYQYCSDSMTRLLKDKDISLSGKKWIISIANCLQRQLEKVPYSYACGLVKQEAIGSHHVCYSGEENPDGNFCPLPLKDQTKILLTVLPTIAEKGVLKEGGEVLGTCGENLTNEIKNYFKKIMSSIE